MKEVARRGKSAGGQRGYTLIELILVVALVSIIGLAATMAVSQIITGTMLSNDQNTAINQVRNAGQWMGRDGQTAKEVYPEPDDDTLLQLFIWDNSDGSANHTVSYAFVDGADGLKQLHRAFNDEPPEEGMLVAEYIDPDGTSCSWDDVERVLTVTITARLPSWMGDKTETRTFEIKPRPDEPEEET